MENCQLFAKEVISRCHGGFSLQFIVFAAGTEANSFFLNN